MGIEMMASGYQHLLTQDLSFGVDRWLPSDGDSEVLERLADELLAEFSGGLRRQAWRPYAITAGIHGGGEREVWERLVTHIDWAVEANSRCALMLDQRAQLSPAMPAAQPIEMATPVGDQIKRTHHLSQLSVPLDSSSFPHCTERWCRCPISG